MTFPSGNFDYKALAEELRNKFAAASAAPDLAQRLGFEEFLSDRAGEATFNLKIAKLLNDNVPNLGAATLSVALVAGLPTSMMRDSGNIEAMPPEVKDLYIKSRKSMGFMTPSTAPELFQIAMAVNVLNMQTFKDVREKSYVPYERAVSLMMQVETVLDAIPAQGIGAPALEKLFRDEAAELKTAVDDFFKTPDNPPPRKPGR